MQVKRFEAVNIQEAISKIKNELGPDAIILSTKKLKDRGSSLLEVLAAKELDITDSGQFIPALNKGDGGTNGMPDKNQADYPSLLKNHLAEIKKLFNESRQNNDLRTEITEVKESLNTFFDILGLKRKKEIFGWSNQIYYHLISKGISREKAWKAVEAVKNMMPIQGINAEEKSLEVIESMIQNSFPEAEPADNKRIKVLVGPTGVGKTTTLAKLSAHFALHKKKSVGLITTDTYRIAAVEQLKTYARIIGIPLETAHSRDDFIKSLSRLSDKEVIFVDTPGMSQNDSSNLEKLNETLKSEMPFELNLLISLTSSKECMIDVASRYEVFNYNQIILTKADECIKIGFLWDVLAQIEKPVSYITNGQNVPQDIENASPQKIARMIMGIHFN